jgi:hypothetical protein
MIWPSVLRLWRDVSQKYIPESEEFTGINNVTSRCALGSCHACLPILPAVTWSDFDDDGVY